MAKKKKAISIEKLMSRSLASCVIDKKLIRNLKHFNILFLNKNNDHTEFFGSPLLGCYEVHMMPNEVAKILEVIGLDFEYFNKNLKRVSSLDVKWKIIPEPLSLSIVYLMHKFITSKTLSDKDRLAGAHELIKLFQYRTLSALISDRIHFTTPKHISLAAYEALSDRFLIRKLGSWEKVIIYIANDVLDSTKLKANHYKTLDAFNNDKDIIYALTSTHGRINSMFKDIYDIIVNITIAKTGLQFSNMSISDDEADKIKEVTKHPSMTVDKVLVLANNDTDFIDHALIRVVTDIIPRVYEDKFIVFLRAITYNLVGKQHKRFKKFITDAVLYNSHYLTTIEQVDSMSLSDIVLVLSHGLRASRSNDVLLKRLRKEGNALIKKNVKGITSSSIVSLRNAFFLYIFLLTFK